jgi:hypothetical protein
VKKLIFVALALLQGCAGEVVPDYPSHDTAVVKTYVHNLGFKGFFASEGTRIVSTRADMRRSEDQFQFSGFMMRHLVKGRDSVHIWRADRNLQWGLNVPDKTYTECPLLGCVSTEKMPERRPQRPAAPQPERPQAPPACALTVVKTRFAVEPAGEKKEIGGFKTSEYKITWEVVARDAAKKKNTSTVIVDLWTTPDDDPRIKAVHAVDRKFEPALYARKESEEDARAKKLIPAEAMQILDMRFMNGFAAARRPSFLGAASELKKIHGFTISTEVKWFLDGNACSEDAPPQQAQAAPASGPDFSHGLSGFLGGGSSAGAAPAEDAGPTPVFGFVEEIREMNVAPASDGLFVPPPSYKLKNPEPAAGG